MSVASSSHQSLAQTLLARKWGIHDDDVSTCYEGPSAAVSYDYMGSRLLKDKSRAKRYIALIVEATLNDLRGKGDTLDVAAIDALRLTRLTRNFPVHVVEKLDPIVRAQLKLRVEPTLPPIPDSPPRAPSSPPPPSSPALPLPPPSSPSLPPPPPTATTSPLAHFLAVDDKGDATQRVEWKEGVVFGRKDLMRNAEVLSTISRRLVTCTRAADGGVLLGRIEGACPLWYSTGDSPTRHALKTSVALADDALHLYHDRNDTAIATVSRA